MYCEKLLLLLVLLGASGSKICSELEECSPFNAWLESAIQGDDDQIRLIAVYVPTERALIAAWPDYEISYAVGLTAEGTENERLPKSQTVCHDFCTSVFQNLLLGKDYRVSLHHSRTRSIAFHAYIPKLFSVTVCNSKASFKWSMDSSLSNSVCLEKLAGNDTDLEWRQKLITTFKNSTEGGDRKKRSLWDGRTSAGIDGDGRDSGRTNGERTKLPLVRFNYGENQNYPAPPIPQRFGMGGFGGFGGPVGGYGGPMAYGFPPIPSSINVGNFKVRSPIPIQNYQHQRNNPFHPPYEEGSPIVHDTSQAENSAQKTISPSIRKAPEWATQINQKEKFQNVHHLPPIERATNHLDSRETHSSRNSSAFLASADEESTSNTWAHSSSYSIADSTLKPKDQGVCTNGRGNEITFQNLDPEASYVAVIHFSNRLNLNVYFETRCPHKQHQSKTITPINTPSPSQLPVLPPLPPLPPFPSLPHLPLLPPKSPPSLLQCPSYTSPLYHGYSWKAQPAGVTVTSACPFPAKGHVVWTCGHDGKWIDNIPDYSNCTLMPNYQEIVHDAQKNFQLDDIMKRSEENLRDAQMAPGDIISTLELMANAHRSLQSESAGSKVTENPRFMEWIITANNRLLTERKAWRGLRTKRKKISLNQIQRIVQMTAIDELPYVPKDSQTIYKKSALYVQIEKYNKKHYKKAKNRKYCHPDKRFDPTCVTLPTFDAKPLNKTVPVTVTAYSTLHCLFPNSAPCDFETNFTVKDVPNTAVMGATIGVSSFSTDKNNPVKLVFRHIFPGDKYKLDNRRCVSWNETEWSTAGCTLVRTDDYVTECNCYHLTNLAVIMDINGILEGHTNLMNLLQLITIIGCSVSIICLALTILLLSLKNTLNPTTTTIHIHLCTTLLIAEVILLVGLDATFDKRICSIIAGLLLYFLLSTFCWSCAESAHIYFLFIKVFSAKSSYLCGFSLFAYIFPAIVVGVSVAITQGRGFGNHQHCWLSYDSHLIWAFAGPTLFMLLVNIIIYLMTLQSFLARGPLADRNVMGQNRRMMRASFTLSTVLYLNWGFGFLYMVKGTEIMAFVFTSLNAFQGLLLFIVIILFNKERVEYMKRKIADYTKKPKAGAVLTMKRSLPSQYGGSPDGTNSSSVVVRK